MDASHGRRRVDRIVSPDYLHGIEDRSAGELRALRDECRNEEAQLSYSRRVLQAQLDITRTEAARRSGETDEDIVTKLPGILADEPSPGRRQPRAVGFRLPEQSGRRLGDLDSPEATLSRLPDLTDAELADLIGRLGEQERRTSQQRRIVLDVLDRLQAELVRRFRDGDVTVEDIMNSTEPGERESAT